MKIIKLTRPALDPRRDLQLRMQEVQHGLSDFVQAMAPPAGWLEIELLEDAPEVPETQSLRAVCRV
jgi:hypothetical protein